MNKEKVNTEGWAGHQEEIMQRGLARSPTYWLARLARVGWNCELTFKAQIWFVDSGPEKGGSCLHKGFLAKIGRENWARVATGRLSWTCEWAERLFGGLGQWWWEWRKVNSYLEWKDGRFETVARLIGCGKMCWICQRPLVMSKWLTWVAYWCPTGPGQEWLHALKASSAFDAGESSGNIGLKYQMPHFTKYDVVSCAAKYLDRQKKSADWCRSCLKYSISHELSDVKLCNTQCVYL